ncbi:sulfotransferase [Candidatus Albibeggiatoa sp. nov. NOAA]|uniref:sulfotransferase family protein n=1 Tax=Candidatus Albibeggiatoa sp. nov. NOAA TaxID=3162724 RepID=UPI0032F423AF|nr:sulfotransferase [Thiotrichaceae bacterium]
MQIKQPIFLVGAERSGTTLLRLMLDHHPNIAFLYEFEFAVDQIDANGNYPNIQQYHEYLAYHRIFLGANLEIDPNLNYAELVNSFLQQKQSRDNKPLIGATVHHQFQHLLKIWPEAKFIHLIRDGRDVARSTIQMGWAGNMYMGVERWIEAELIWKQMAKQLAPEQQISVHYEDLIRDADGVLQRICDFTGVEFDNAMYSYADKTTYSVPDPKILERWRKLPQKDLQLVECRIAEMLTERDYPLSGHPILPDSANLKFRMKMDNRVRNILFRIKRYSFRLWLADLISRRFGFSKWQQQVRLKMNEKDKAYLR